MIVKRSVLKKIYRPRSSWSHKGQFGKLLVVGGNPVYVGAPMFAAVAALHAGCDLVYVAAPQRAADIIARRPDLITYRLTGNHVSTRHLKFLLETSQKMDAVVIGNGIGNRKDTGKSVNVFLNKCKKPTVVDADGLRAAAKNKSVLKGKIVTPHTGEFLALSGKRLGSNINERKTAARRFAENHRCIVILKGHVDVITDGKEVMLNKTGNVYMTKGGTGDTLAGICGALLARGTNAFDAACAAAYINGAAGDIAAREKKESLTASDVIECISKVISKT